MKAVAGEDRSNELVYQEEDREMKDEFKKRLGIPTERNEDQMENEAQGAGV